MDISKQILNLAIEWSAHRIAWSDVLAASKSLAEHGVTSSDLATALELSFADPHPVLVIENTWELCSLFIHDTPLAIDLQLQLADALARRNDWPSLSLALKHYHDVHPKLELGSKLWVMTHVYIATLRARLAKLNVNAVENLREALGGLATVRLSLADDDVARAHIVFMEAQMRHHLASSEVDANANLIYAIQLYGSARNSLAESSEMYVATLIGEAACRCDLAERDVASIENLNLGLALLSAASSMPTQSPHDREAIAATSGHARRALAAAGVDSRANLVASIAMYELALSLNADEDEASSINMALKDARRMLEITSGGAP